MEDVIEAMARAGDAEDSANRGEPTPWREDIAGNDPVFRSERLAVYRAALAAAEAQGWKLVPVEATEDMVIASYSAKSTDAAWSAMVAAAPSPTAKE